MAYNFFLQPI